MNWLDYTILILIVVSVLYGAVRGLIHSLFKFAGLIASIIITKMYYGYVTKFIIDNTNIVASVNTFIAKKNLDGGSLNTGLMEELYMTLPVGMIIDDFTGYIAMVIINCIALFITFIIVKLCLSLLELLLKEVFKLPVLSTINHSGGAILGLVESILILLLIFALAVPISTFSSLSYINSSIEASVLSKYFYSYNFILKWILDNALNIILH